MKKYDWILFDIDETLLRFDSFLALQTMFSRFDIVFSEQHFIEYETKNKLLWKEYQHGNITIMELQKERFAAWGNQLNISPLDLNNTFLETVMEVTTPLDGAVQLLNTLHGKIKLGIVTNGFTKTQSARIQRSGLLNHFDFIVTSEEIGIAKPQPGIFEHAFLQMGNPARNKILMVGDTLESDILGGINAGIHTCWLNTYKKLTPENITPHFQIFSLVELENLLLQVL